MSDVIEHDDQKKPARSLGVKNIMLGLSERGKIKIGNKGAKRKAENGNEWQAPQKLDHFLVTTLSRDAGGNFARDEEFHKKHGDKPREIPVVLIYDDVDLNFPTRYACYNGKKLWCSGDGESANRLMSAATPASQGKPAEPAKYQQVSCTCFRQDPAYTGRDKCKINGTLSAIITGIDVIGAVWKFRTTSYNSVVGILSSLSLIKRITGGPLAGVPLTMTVNPKSVANPVDGAQQTVYVVGLEYRGNVESLQQRGYTELLTRQSHSIRIEKLEEDARRLISHDPQSYAAADDDADEIAEFYPEQMGADAAEVVEDVQQQTQASAPALAAAPAAAGLAGLNQAARTRQQRQPEPEPEIIEGELVDGRQEQEQEPTPAPAPAAQRKAKNTKPADTPAPAPAPATGGDAPIDLF